MRITDWSSDVYSSVLVALRLEVIQTCHRRARFDQVALALLALAFEFMDGHVLQQLRLFGTGDGQLLAQIADTCLQCHGALVRSIESGWRGRQRQRWQCGGRGCHLGFVRAGRRELRVEASSEEHTSELQSLMRISYAVFCLK